MIFSPQMSPEILDTVLGLWWIYNFGDAINIQEDLADESVALYLETMVPVYTKLEKPCETFVFQSYWNAPVYGSILFLKMYFVS